MVNLAHLIADLTQFATPEILRTSSVLFPNPTTVADLRKWVLVAGEFPEVIWARRLQRTFRTLIRGKPIHSHAAERLVNQGVQLQRRGAHGTSEERSAIVMGLSANGTRVDWREARGEYEKEFAAHLAVSLIFSRVHGIAP